MSLGAALGLLLATNGEVASVTVASPPERPIAEASAAPRWWLGVGGRNAFGLSGAVEPDFGAELFAGTWLLHEHLQPIVKAGWSWGKEPGVDTIDAFRFAGELAAGSAFFDEHLWLGASAGLGFVEALAQSSRGDSSASGAMITASALLQGRFAHRLLAGIELGPEVVAPTLHFTSVTATAAWTAVRFNAGLRLGVILGPAIP